MEVPEVWGASELDGKGVKSHRTVKYEPGLNSEGL